MQSFKSNKAEINEDYETNPKLFKNFEFDPRIFEKVQQINLKDEIM